MPTFYGVLHVKLKSIVYNLFLIKLLDTLEKTRVFKISIITKDFKIHSIHKTIILLDVNIYSKLPASNNSLMHDLPFYKPTSI